MSKIKWDKYFRLDNGAVIECGWQKTRYGFRHLAVLSGKGQYVETKACYYNRTWESYEYATVIHKAIRKAFPDDAEALIEKVDAQARGEIDDRFKMIAGIAKLGEIFCDNQKDKNDWKENAINHLGIKQNRNQGYVREENNARPQENHQGIKAIKLRGLCEFAIQTGFPTECFTNRISSRER